jgi:predicted AAA+ superfamily ATPase
MKIEEALLLLNEWWQTGEVARDRLKEYKRDSYQKVRELLSYRQVTILTGMRRVGKTTLMFQLIDELLRETKPGRILYYSFDEGPRDVLDLFKGFQKLTKTDWKKEKIFVFLDEIQKLKNWSSKVKLIYDHFTNVKFMISGSASLMLESEAMENLAGRYFMEEIPPLSIKEYFELKRGTKIENFNLYRSELELEVEDYLKRPFPEIVNWTEERRVYEYIKETVLSKIMKIDIPEVFGKVDVLLLEKLIELIFSEPGIILNLESLSKDLGVQKRTLLQHLYYLEFSKLVRILRNFRVSALAESRKLRKAYPYDASLVFPIHPSVDRGKILECAVVSRTGAKNYWRQGTRGVDFILKQPETLAVEVKSKENLGTDDLRTLQWLSRKRGIKGVVIYLGESKMLGTIRALNFLDFLWSGITPAHEQSD